MFKVIAATGAIYIGLAGVGGAQDAEVSKGMQVYADQKCAICHSVGGKGNVKGPLDDVGSRLSVEELRQWIVDATGMTAKTKAPRKPVMKNYSLPKDDLDALVAYLATLKKK